MGLKVPPGWQEGSYNGPKPFQWGPKTIAFAQPKHTRSPYGGVLDESDGSTDAETQGRAIDMPVHVQQ